MQLEVTNLKTKHIMYAWFPCRKDAKSTLSFYRVYKENGSKKYSVKNISNAN